MYTTTFTAEVILEDTHPDDVYAVLEYNFTEPKVLMIEDEGINLWVKFKYKQLIKEPK